MRSAECGVRNFTEGSFASRDLPLHSAFRIPHSALLVAMILIGAPDPSGAQQLPPLPDTSGFGVHVLALTRAPANALWVGTYGEGVFEPRPGAGGGDQSGHSTDTSAD